MDTIITTKSQIIAAFGSGAAAARAMGTTKQYVSSWPDNLPKKIAYWATGALLAKKQGESNGMETPHGTEATPAAGSGNTVTPTVLEGGITTQGCTPQPVEH